MKVVVSTSFVILFCVCYFVFVFIMCDFVFILFGFLRFSRRYSCAAIVSAGNKGLANLLCHIEYFQITKSTQSVHFKMTRLDCQYTILPSEFCQ